MRRQNLLSELGFVNQLRLSNLRLDGDDKVSFAFVQDAPEMSGQDGVSARKSVEHKDGGIARALGLGLITGAADDDCSAIGTFATAGARFGPDLLWAAPVTLPMMYVVVYLSSKLGQVSGRGLFKVMADFYPRWLLWSILVGVLVGNTIEAAADLGAMAAAMRLFLPLPALIVILVASTIFALQMFGSYELIRNIVRWLALALLSYLVSAVLAKPDLALVLQGTLLTKIQFSREYLSILVAIIGTTLSAYLYTWQANQEVEEEIAEGRTSLEDRKGATRVSSANRAAIS